MDAPRRLTQQQLRQLETDLAWITRNPHKVPEPLAMIGSRMRELLTGYVDVALALDRAPQTDTESNQPDEQPPTPDDPRAPVAARSHGRRPAAPKPKSVDEEDPGEQDTEEAS